MKPIRKIVLATSALLAVAALLLARPRSAPPPLSRWTPVETAWRSGRVVLLIRHMERCDRSSDPCLDGPHGITVAGAEAARALRQALEARLDLSRADRYHSPVLRTTQTARLLFGDASRPAPWLRHGCKTQWRRRILAHKRRGWNLVLVTHATCLQHLKDAAGHPLIHRATLNDRGYGIAWFLETDPDGKRLHPLGYLRPGDWERLPPAWAPGTLQPSPAASILDRSTRHEE